LLLHGNNGYVNAPQCYVMRTLSVLCHSHTWQWADVTDSIDRKNNDSIQSQTTRQHETTRCKNIYNKK